MSRRIRVSHDVYNEIENIKKNLINKAGLHKELTIGETMDIIWKAREIHGINIGEIISNISKENIKIAWGSRGRGSKKKRRGRLNVSLNGRNVKPCNYNTPYVVGTQVNK